MANQSAQRYGSSFLTAMLGAAFFDMLVEILNIPFLNDTPVISPSGKATSNYEMAVYIISVLMIGGGGISLFTGKRIFGLSAEEFFTGFGAAFGTQSYETWLAQQLGLRPQIAVPA